MEEGLDLRAAEGGRIGAEKSGGERSFGNDEVLRHGERDPGDY